MTGTSGDEPSHEILQDRTRSWWASVLTGQIEGAHPIHGTNLRVALHGDTLVLSGTVPSDEDRAEIEQEVAHLRTSGITTIENQLVVTPTTTDQTGLLTQTLLAVFETPERASFAERFLTEHVHVHPHTLDLIDPATGEAAEALVRARLPEAWWPDATRALAAERTLLLVTVDETEAFKAREVLDEETRSLETSVLPPRAAADGHAVTASPASAASAEAPTAPVAPVRRPAVETGGAG